MMHTSTQPCSDSVVVFDGVCHLCDGFVRWIIARDKKSRFRFASLQSPAGQNAIARARGDSPTSAIPDSMVLIDTRGLHVRSDAALRILGGLGFPYSMLCICYLVPRGLRDAVYDWIARNRYRWFGQWDSCPLPTPELRARFLDTEESQTQ